MRGRSAAAAVVGDVVVFGAGDPAGREEERVQLHAHGLPSHVLHGELRPDGEERFDPSLICLF